MILSINRRDCHPNDQVETVASLTDVPLKSLSSLDLAPDDSPFVLRDTTLYELYALDWVAP